MERKAMMGHLVSKSLEGCGTIGDNTGAVKHSCPKTVSLDMQRPGP